MYGVPQPMPMGGMPFQHMPGWPHMMPAGYPVEMHAVPGMPDAATVLKLSGLPFAASAKDVSNFFDGFAVVSCSIHHGIDGRPSGMVRLAHLAAPGGGSARLCSRAENLA